jgi:hypothetical protein
METFTPEQAAFYLATTLPALESEHAMTKKILEALPVHSSSRAIDGLSAADGGEGSVVVWRKLR